jgi:hypothetical protein
MEMQFAVWVNTIFHAVGTQNWHVINMAVKMDDISLASKGNDIISFMNVAERVIFEKSPPHKALNLYKHLTLQYC